MKNMFVPRVGRIELYNRSDMLPLAGSLSIGGRQSVDWVGLQAVVRFVGWGVGIETNQGTQPQMLSTSAFGH